MSFELFTGNFNFTVKIGEGRINLNLILKYNNDIMGKIKIPLCTKTLLLELDTSIFFQLGFNEFINIGQFQSNMTFRNTKMTMK